MSVNIDLTQLGRGIRNHFAIEISKIDKKSGCSSVRDGRQETSAVGLVVTANCGRPGIEVR